MAKVRFPFGTSVRIRKAWPPGHVRTPFYLRGRKGEICHVIGPMGNPEELAYGRVDSPNIMVYRVRLRQTEIWEHYAGPPQDTLTVDVYENWLEPVEEVAA